MFNNANIHYNKLAKGSPFPNADNLQGAWLHKKAPQDTIVLDERAGIDKTREPIRGQGLKFTGVESIYSGYTPTLSSSTTFKIETEVIFSGISSTNQYIVDFRNSINTGFFIGTEVNSLELKFRITGTNVNTGVILELNTRYFIEFSYNCSTGVATIILNGIEVYSNTVSYNDAYKATRNLALGRVSYTSAIELLATLGYFRFIENDVPVIEYSFEDGLTDTVYNRISNNYHGTISGATLDTFRVEDDRITNGDNGSYWNQEGGSDYITLFEEDFSTDVGWTLIEEVFIEDGQLVFNNAPSNSTAAFEGYGSAAGKKVRVTVIASDYVSGLLQVKNFGGSNFLAYIDGNGTFVFEATIGSGGNQNWGFGTSTGSTTIKVDYFKVEIIDVRVPRAVTLNLSLGSNLIPLNFVGISLDSNASVVDGKLVLNNSSGVTRYTGIVSSGKTYKIIITLDSVVSGAIKVWVGGNNTANITTAGTYEYLISKGTINDWVGVNPAVFTGVVSYLSCQEVLSVDSIEPLNTDVLGQPLTYTKPAAINLQMVNSNCGNFHSNDVDIALNETLILTDFTVVALVYLDSTQIAVNSSRTFSKGNTHTIGDSSIIFRGNQGYIRSNGGTTGYVNWDEGGSFSNSVFDSWQIMVLRRTIATNKFEVYIGNEKKTVTEINSSGLEHTMTIINDGFGFGGRIAYYAIYNRSFSDSEIENWNPTSPHSDGLLKYLMFSSGNGNVIYDVSTRKIHGTVLNSTLATFWGSKENLFHWNLRKGFQRYLDFSTQLIEIKVPYDVQGNPMDVTTPFFENTFTSNNTGVTSSEASLIIQTVAGRQALKVTCLLNQNTHRITVPTSVSFPASTFAYLVTFDYYIPSGQTIDRFQVSNISSINAPTSSVKDQWTSVSFYVSGTNAFQLRFVDVNGNFLLGDQGGEWIAFSNFKMIRYITGNSSIPSSLHPAGKWHNGAETEFNAPSCPELVIADKQFDIGFWYDDTTALYSKASQKVLADGGEIILTEEEVRSFLSPNWKRASFLYIPFARKAGKSYSLIGEDLTVDRNSAATETNRQLLLEQVSANVPRIEFDANGPKGHLIEGQGTNRVRTDFAFLSGWDDAGGDVSVSLNDAEDDSYLLTPSGTDVKYISDFFDANEGDEINGFIEVKSAGSDFNIRVNIRSSGGLITTDEYAVTSEWTKIILSATVPLGESDASMQIGGANTWVTGENLLVRRPQLVKNEPAGTWIKNTSSAAVTRLAEGIPMPTAWANATESDNVLLLLKATFQNPDSSNSLAIFNESTSFDAQRWFINANSQLIIYSNATNVIFLTGIPFNDLFNTQHNILFRKVGSSISLYIDGNFVDEKTLLGDFKWNNYISPRSNPIVHQIKLDTDNPDNWTDEYCKALSELGTTVPRFEASDIQYADIVDNYEDADTLFADVAEDNKRMKLLQYKNPLTE